MPLYEYYCGDCHGKFEQITSASDPDQGKCLKCHGKNTRKLLSRFAIGGQGDLRESTLHGCHDCMPGPGDESSHDSHGEHDHSGPEHDH